MGSETWLGAVDAGWRTGLLAGAAVLLLGGVVAGVLRALRRRHDAGAVALLQQQLESLRAQMGQALASQTQLVTQELGQLTAQIGDRLRDNVEQLQRGQTSMGERLDSATRVVTEVQHGLGELRQATARVYEVGKDVASLHDILRAPKPRGGLGELLLADLLGQVLPAAHFGLQHGFRDGERVDAVIRLGDGLVPIDAKFPLEDFRRLLSAVDDAERGRIRKAFVARVRKHVDDIAAKYIRPDEQTYDFAFMYIPAENVYYETILRDDADGGLSAYALDQKVIPTSPSSLYAYLQAIVLGLRGMRIESRALEVMGQLQRLSGDLGRLRDDVRLVGKHLTNAAQAFAGAERRLDRFEAKLVAIGGDEPQEGPQMKLVHQQP